MLGVGLIGGSIGLAARGRLGAHVCGYDTDPAVLLRAGEQGAIDEAAPDIAAAVADADVVFAAAPVGALPATVAAALAAASPECVVSDVGSTKRPLAEHAADERFVGGHPLAGAETAGVEHAREDLFDGAIWYLTPAPGTSGVLYERLHRLCKRLGAQPVAIDAELHDRLMATVSHLPHVLANVLVAQGAGVLGGAELIPATGPSFRDATRVAGANSAIWTDIYLSNRDVLVETIDETIDRLGAARDRIAGARRDEVAAWNDAARADRERLLGAGLAGGDVHELRASVPNRPGVIADIALALGRSGVNIVDMALSPSADNRQGVVALWVRGDEQARAGRGADRRPALSGGEGLTVRFDPASRLEGELDVPPDKSISHRAALLGAMASDPVRITNYLGAADTNSTLAATEALGVLVERRPEANEIVMRGSGLREAREPDGPIDVGNAGTLMRLLPGWLAAQRGRRFVLDGDESIRRRPVDRIVEPLREMGADLEATDGRYPPLIVTGAPLHSISYELPMASAQVKSCVLLAALLADGATTVGEPARSRDHTERMLLSAGATIHRNGRHVTVAGCDELVLGDIAVPGDLSSAAFLITAGVLVKGSQAAAAQRRRQLDPHRLRAHPAAHGRDRPRRPGGPGGRA